VPISATERRENTFTGADVEAVTNHLNVVLDLIQSEQGFEL